MRQSRLPPQRSRRISPEKRWRSAESRRSNCVEPACRVTGQLLVYDLLVDGGELREEFRFVREEGADAVLVHDHSPAAEELLETSAHCRTDRLPPGVVVHRLCEFA